MPSDNGEVLILPWNPLSLIHMVFNSAIWIIAHRTREIHLWDYSYMILIRSRLLSCMNDSMAACCAAGKRHLRVQCGWMIWGRGVYPACLNEFLSDFTRPKLSAEYRHHTLYICKMHSYRNSIKGFTEYQCSMPWATPCHVAGASSNHSLLVSASSWRAHKSGFELWGNEPQCSVPRHVKASPRNRKKQRPWLGGHGPPTNQPPAVQTLPIYY